LPGPSPGSRHAALAPLPVLEDPADLSGVPERSGAAVLRPGSSPRSQGGQSRAGPHWVANGATIAAPTHERPRTPSNSATDRAGMTVYELGFGPKAGSWALTTKADHNSIRQGPIPADAPKATAPGERRYPTAWAYFANSPDVPAGDAA